MTSKEKAYAVIEWAELQGVEIKYKDESLFMKALGLLLSFNKTFMTSFTTTIGSTIYFPSRKWLAERNPETTIAIVAHEVTHVMDSRMLGTLRYVTKYLAPQLGALGALGAFGAIWGGPWFLLFLGCLVCLAPWGSSGRTQLELKGYATSMAVAAWLGHPYSSPPAWVAKQFSGPNYYFMCRDTAKVNSSVAIWIARINDDNLYDDLPHLKEVKRICTMGA